jgi:RNA polymerase sigma factor (sigma-70 family)
MSTFVNPEEFERMRMLARGLSLGDEADDLVQEAVLEQLEGKRRDGTDSYVRRSLWLRSLTRRRSDQRRRQREAAFAAMASAPDDREVAIVALALRQALLRLSTEQRSLLEARYIEGRAPAELASDLHISPEAVRQRIHRALARLQAEFDDSAPQRRPGLLALAFGDFGRRRRIMAGIGLAVAIPAVVIATCMIDSEREVAEPDPTADAPRSAGNQQPAARPVDEPATTGVAIEGSDASKPPPPVPDRLGAALFLREYKQTYALISTEVRSSFIECLTEYNKNPPPAGERFGGRSEFRVHLRHDPETGSFVDEVEVVEDGAAASELATCVRESLPSIRFEDPELVTPAAFRVVLDLDRKVAFAKAELDLTGLPAQLRDDEALLDTLGGYLGRDEPPAELAEAIAELADALRDGVVEADELTSETLEVLVSLAEAPGR